MPTFTDPRTALEQEGVRMRNWSIGDHKTTCPHCSHERHKKRETCLSITVQPEGEIVYMCHHCQWSGCVGKGHDRLRGRERVIRKPQPPAAPVAPPAIESKPLSARSVAFFADRGIDAATLDHFGIVEVERWMPSMDGQKNRAVVFPYRVNGTLVNRKYRAVEQKVFIQDRGTRRTLFNIDSCAEAGTVVIVEGEMDVLSVHQSGWPAVVSLPDGSGKSGNEKRLDALRQSGLLQRTANFILAGDLDESGLALRKALIGVIGAKRCRTVRWPTAFDVKCKDANEALWLHGPEVVLECINLSTPCGGGSTAQQQEQDQ